MEKSVNVFRKKAESLKFQRLYIQSRRPGSHAGLWAGPEWRPPLLPVHAAGHEGKEVE